MAHPLTPVVHIGKEGVTKEVVQATVKALFDHELIKLKLLVDTPLQRKMVSAKIASQTASEVVQIIGRVLVLYRPRPKKPTLKVPKGYTAPGPASRAHDEDE